MKTLPPFLRLLSIGLLFISAFSYGQPGSETTPAVDLLRLEPLQAISVEKDKLSITVKSNGCTSSEHFRLLMDEPTLSIVRLKPDRCRKRTEWLTLTLPLPQTAHGISVLANWEDIYINNPLALSD